MQWKMERSWKHVCRSLSRPTALYSTNHNLIGPPDRESNIRPIRLKRVKSPAEARVHKLQVEVWNYNHDFWKRHNTEFKESKAEFARSNLAHRGKAVSKLTTNELSVFYKEFLNNNYDQHILYMRGWIQLQWLLTWNILKLRLNQMLQVIFKFKSNA